MYTSMVCARRSLNRRMIMQKYTNAPRGENMVFRALYLMAIVFVVDGHTTLADMFTLDGLFRYYSFHLMLFAFGAGYFFRLRGSLAEDILSRAKRMLLPLYGWNLVYGAGAAALRRFGGFELGAPVNAYTLLLAPICDGEHFVWNLGSWFIFPLFMAQVLYCLIRRAAKWWKDNEWITFLAALIPGVIAVMLCGRGENPAAPVYILRPLILLPGYAGGMLYKTTLEKRDTLPTVPYLLIVVILRALLCVRYENLAYLLSNCTYFVCGPFGVYAGAALAIAFFLRMARLIAPYMEKSRLALYISRSTFAVMMHHYMGFFAVNCVFLCLNALGIWAQDFSVKSFRTMENYNYAPGGHTEFNVLYLLAGLLVPLAVAFVMDKAKALAAKAAGRIRKSQA